MSNLPVKHEPARTSSWLSLVNPIPLLNRVFGSATTNQPGCTLSWQKDLTLGADIIATLTSGHSKKCASVSISGSNLIADTASYQQKVALEKQLLPIAAKALLETIREVSGVEPVRDQELLAAEPVSDMRLSFQIGADQNFGRGVDIISHVPNTEETAKLGHISLWFKNLRSDQTTQKVAEIFTQRFLQALTLERDRINTTPSTSVPKQINS